MLVNSGQIYSIKRFKPKCQEKEKKGKNILGVDVHKDSNPYTLRPKGPM